MWDGRWQLAVREEGFCNRNANDHPSQVFTVKPVKVYPRVTVAVSRQPLNWTRRAGVTARGAAHVGRAGGLRVE